MGTVPTLDASSRIPRLLACVARVLAMVALAVSLSVGTTSAQVAPADSSWMNEEGQCTVLLYHKFNESQYPTTNIDVDDLREQLAYLRDNHYTVLDMKTFTRHLDEREPFPPRSVLITIDDPYVSIFEHGWPVFQEFGYPISLFVWTQCLEGSYGAMMSWTQLEEMAAAGVTIGNHTHSHPRLALPAEGETREAFRERVREELVTSKRLLAEHGMDSPYFAYPYGEYNLDVIEIAGDVGFEYRFTQDRGPLDHTWVTERIPREALVGAEQTLGDVVEKLRLEPLRVGQITPAPGRIVSHAPETIELAILDPSRYDGTVNVFVSELGRVDASYDASSGITRVDGPVILERDWNRVLVSIRNPITGRWALHSHLLVTGR